jgi:hypothetical protein
MWRLLAREGLQPLGSVAVMVGKLAWFESVTEVDLTSCGDTVSGVLAELESIPSLRNLSLPASCARSAVDAEAVCGLTTLTKLRFMPEDEEAGEWVLDFSRLTSLTSLDLEWAPVKDKQVQELSNLTGLTALNLLGCSNLTSEVLLELSSLTALTTLKLSLPGSCAEDAAYVEAVCGLTTLTALRFHAEFDEYGDIVEEVGEWKLDFSRLKTLTSLHLEWCFAVTDKQVQELSNLTALSTLSLFACDNVTAAAKQALRTAIPNLTIRG